MVLFLKNSVVGQWYLSCEAADKHWLADDMFFFLLLDCNTGLVVLICTDFGF